MKKNKKSFKVFGLEMTKAVIGTLALLAVLAIAGLIESVLAGNLFWVIVSILILLGSVALIMRISKTKNFKIINRLEGPNSLGEEMK